MCQLLQMHVAAWASHEGNESSGYLGVCVVRLQVVVLSVARVHPLRTLRSVACLEE